MLGVVGKLAIGRGGEDDTGPASTEDLECWLVGAAQDMNFVLLLPVD